MASGAGVLSGVREQGTSSGGVPVPRGRPGTGWCEVGREVGVWGERALVIFYGTQDQILCTHYLCPSAGMCQACCVSAPVPHLCSVCMCTRAQALESIVKSTPKLDFVTPPPHSFLNWECLPQTRPWAGL